MARRKGAKNKNPVSACERYWLGRFGDIHLGRFNGNSGVTEKTLRVHKHRARKEKKAADAAWAAEVRRAIASGGLCPPCVREAKAELAEFDRDGLVYHYTGEDPDADLRGAGYFRVLASMRAAAMDDSPYSPSDEDVRADHEEHRRIRREKLLAQVDEAREEAKRRRAAKRNKL